MRAVIVDGAAVGWLTLVPYQQATATADVRFQHRQLKQNWLIGLGTVIVAALAAWWLSRLLVTPLTRIASATHNLASGDYSVRIPVNSKDEIGRLLCRCDMSEGARILIVEDGPKLSQLLADYLTAAGYQPQIVNNGLDAVPALKASGFDLMLLDLMLPGRDGLDVCKDVRTFSNIPIVMVTARVEEIAGDELIESIYGAGYRFTL